MTAIYKVKIEGNLQNITRTLPSVLKSKYNRLSNKTEVTLKGTEIDVSEQILRSYYRLHEDLEKHKRSSKQEQVEVEYIKLIKVK